MYGTAVSLLLLREVNAPLEIGATLEGLKGFDPHSAFESALLISSLLSLGTDIIPANPLSEAERLTRLQRTDGSWSATPSLRTTRRDSFTPWNSPDAGPLFADPGRVFATATVLEVFSRLVAIM
jgi:hypothetical protein